MGRTTFYLLEQEQKQKKTVNRKGGKEARSKKETKNTKIDWEGKIKKYAVLNDKGIETGWYDIPGQESKIQGKEKAIQALKESDS